MKVSKENYFKLKKINKKIAWLISRNAEISQDIPFFESKVLKEENDKRKKILKSKITKLKNERIKNGSEINILQNQRNILKGV